MKLCVCCFDHLWICIVFLYGVSKIEKIFTKPSFSSSHIYIRFFSVLFTFMDEIHIFETYGESYKKSYIIKPSKNIKLCINKDYVQWRSFATFFMTVFLPHGYPDSVSDDYLQYQIWDSVQAFASSISGGLCTHAILKGAGVGDENASPIAATITWLLKDGSSMIGRIGFAWLQGTKLDCDCKKWRLFADIINDAAMLLDLLSSYFQNLFLPIVCSSGILKAMVGVAGGCTRAAVTQHQARKNNMADVSAKDGSQETLVNLLALLCNLFLIPTISQNQISIWLLFMIMTLVHLMANYKAVKSIVLEKLNEERFEIYAKHYFEEGLEKRLFLSVKEVNQRENISFISFPIISVKLGTSFSDIIKDKSAEEIQNLFKVYKNCDYILGVSSTHSKGFINIAFNKKITAKVQMEALFQACYIKHLLESVSPNLKGNENSVCLEASSREFAVKRFQDFFKSLETMHFDVSLVTFNVDLWRLEW